MKGVRQKEKDRLLRTMTREDFVYVAVSATGGDFADGVHGKGVQG